MPGERRSIADVVPPEVKVVLAFCIVAFGVVSTGGAISAAIDQPNPWLFAAAYGGPASIAFGIHWMLTRRLAAAVHEIPDEETEAPSNLD